MVDWMAVGPGLAVAVLGTGLSYWWFGVQKRKQLELAAGVQALSGMKWRECAGLILEALTQQGYREELSSRQPGDGGTEFLLRRGDDSVLMSYKHGTAYRLGDSNIREFANAIQLSGAGSGILITLGTIEGVARALARRYEIRLMDGSNIWPLVQNLVPVGLHTSIQHQAATQNRIGLWTGSATSLLLGSILALAGMGSLSPDDSEDPESVTTAPAAPATATTAAPANPAVSPAATQAAASPAANAPLPLAIDSREGIEAANRAMAEIAKLSDVELAKRRADVAAKIAGMAQVRSASWSTQSTLILNLAQSDGKDVALISETCNMLSRYEELRYTRLQLEPPQSSDFMVRWRACQ